VVFSDLTRLYGLKKNKINKEYNFIKDIYRKYPERRNECTFGSNSFLYMPYSFNTEFIMEIVSTDSKRN